MSSYWELTVLSGRVYNVRRRDSLCTDFVTDVGKIRRVRENKMSLWAQAHVDLKMGPHIKQILVAPGGRDLVRER